MTTISSHQGAVTAPDELGAFEAEVEEKRNERFLIDTELML